MDLHQELSLGEVYEVTHSSLSGLCRFRAGPFEATGSIDWLKHASEVTLEFVPCFGEVSRVLPVVLSWWFLSAVVVDSLSILSHILHLKAFRHRHPGLLPACAFAISSASISPQAPAIEAGESPHRHPPPQCPRQRLRLLVVADTDLGL